MPESRGAPSKRKQVVDALRELGRGTARNIAERTEKLTLSEVKSHLAVTDRARVCAERTIREPPRGQRTVNIYQFVPEDEPFVDLWEKLTEDGDGSR